MRVLVCGGRNFHDGDMLIEALNEIHAATPITLVIQGGAAGADRLAGYWAYRRAIECKVYPAQWKRYGNRIAGPIRNQLMLDDGKPDLVVAFPGGSGTADMVRRARTAGVPVRIYP
jgi:hypothetical protein